MFILSIVYANFKKLLENVEAVLLFEGSKIGPSKMRLKKGVFFDLM